MVSEAIFRKRSFAGKERIMNGKCKMKLFGARGVISNKEREIGSGRQQQRYTCDPPRLGCWNSSASEQPTNNFDAGGDVFHQATSSW